MIFSFFLYCFFYYLCGLKSIIIFLEYELLINQIEKNLSISNTDAVVSQR